MPALPETLQALREVVQAQTPPNAPRATPPDQPACPRPRQIAPAQPSIANVRDRKPPEHPKET